ncbi:pentapeptide repeat-containing protein [Rhodovulum sulfidophilum]|uniref:pentapeptide repeat-containing protein n=1 Tax=Rhodovulum sulfidophilum TaxID=35806 RepID=UPI001920E6D9|nr:pentapeptide repeat-containing protein [Rhodovulum sulfidophilum]MBL3595527.1 pentapeptide repeat-containing protein [Rhodovulum sulfidophilum]
MGNPEHLEWLLEGVAAWNARRRRRRFAPDLSGMDIREAFEKAGRLADNRIDLTRVDLREADLRKATLKGANLQRADLWGADFSGANLETANLENLDLFGLNFGWANLKKAKLGSANFTFAILDGANLEEACLRQTILNAAKLDRTNFTGTDFEATRIRTVFIRPRAERAGRPEHTDLSLTLGLTQAQIERISGDTGTILPNGLYHPTHWRDPEPTEDTTFFYDAPPSIPNNTASKNISEKDGRLFLVNIAPPPRSDLETIHGDLREDLAALLASGAFDNISKGLGTALSRYAGIVDCAYADLDQVRFGVQTRALRLKLETHRQDLSDAAPEKTGDLEAALLSAELIAARLPDWQTFLKETADERSPVAEHEKEITEAIENAAEEMREDPAHFAPALPERVSEYLNTATIEGYLAATALLNDLAFVAMAELRRLVRDTGSEARKLAVKGLALNVVAGLGATLTKLAGILPAEFDWVLPWLRYIPTLFG